MYSTLYTAEVTSATAERKELSRGLGWTAGWREERGVKRGEERCRERCREGCRWRCRREVGSSEGSERRKVESDLGVREVREQE